MDNLLQNMRIRERQKRKRRMESLMKLRKMMRMKMRRRRVTVMKMMNRHLQGNQDRDKRESQHHIGIYQGSPKTCLINRCKMKSMKPSQECSLRYKMKSKIQRRKYRKISIKALKQAIQRVQLVVLEVFFQSKQRVAPLQVLLLRVLVMHLLQQQTHSSPQVQVKVS